MPALFFDTETTGLPNYDRPVDPPSQPHIVQLAAILVDDDGIERASLNTIIKPEGWTIPEGAAAVHGISTELAAAVGIEIRAALGVFLRLRRIATTAVAHNIKFDLWLTETAIRRDTRAQAQPSYPESNIKHPFHALQIFLIFIVLIFF